MDKHQITELARQLPVPIPEPVALGRARARGWALWKALATIGLEKQGRGDGQAAARRFGWRRSPRQVVDLLIAG